MTVCSPPLINPNGRFSRIRLSEFLARETQLPGCKFVTSVGREEGLGRPARVSPQGSAVVAPEPLPRAVGEGGGGGGSGGGGQVGVRRHFLTGSPFEMRDPSSQMGRERMQRTPA